MSSSRVWVTAPSIEFSTGTTPCSASPRSTRAKTSATVVWGRSSMLVPKERSAASWVKVASGPRYATFRRVSRETEVEMISRNTASSPRLGKPPSPKEATRSRTRRSLAGA